MINVIFLQHRRNFIPVLEFFVSKIKPENKKHLKFYFLMTSDYPVKFNAGVDYEVKNYGGNQFVNNYRSKFMWALEQPCEYFFKLDEDIIFSNHVWDYMIENREMVKQADVMTLSPSINIGVPSVDLFIESFCPDRKEEIEKLFLATDINTTAGARWGFDFEHFNDFTTRATSWDRQAFHQRLTEIDIRLKGIHPIRFNPQAEQLMMDIVLNDVYKFISKSREYEPTTLNCPYFVNDLCLYDIEKLRQAERDMGFDPYDEVSMNIWTFNKGLKHVYLKHAYSLHSFYAFVSGGQNNAMEQTIHDTILNKSQEIYHYELV